MTYLYASEQRAIGQCDRCGLAYPLRELKYLVVRAERTGSRVCPECWEPDHPQNKQGMTPINDPQALQDPRPDAGLAASRQLYWGWAPVGGGVSGVMENPLGAKIHLGYVQVGV